MATRKNMILAVAGVLASAGAALAQPTILSLGSGSPNGCTPKIGSNVYISGSGTAARLWTVSGSGVSVADIGGLTSSSTKISADGNYICGLVLNNPATVIGNTASGVTPAFRTDPTLTASPLATTSNVGGLYRTSTSAWSNIGGLPIDGALHIFGSGTSGTTCVTPFNISANGRFICGSSYISAYSTSAGNTITTSPGFWRPFVWDRDGNAGAGKMYNLITPPRTSSNTWRRRTGQAYAVSNDGQVVCGWQEHNVASSGAPDPDGGRPMVWRWNAGTNSYDMSYLPNGVDGSGFPITYSATAGNMHISPDGNIIVGASSGGMAKWTWDAGTSTWSSPVVIGTNLSTPASWLPSSVTSCGVPPQFFVYGMSDDGNTIVGNARYSTCGSFMSAGFIWHNSDGLIQDWYDYLVAQGTVGIGAYGPIGDNGNPARGLPRLGTPLSISGDGNVVVNQVLGPQLIVGAVPSVVMMSGGPSCVTPVVVTQPTATTNISKCSSGVNLSCIASGSATEYTWFKGGVQLTDGVQASGSTVFGATTNVLSISGIINPAQDAGTYYCVVASNCGNVQSANAVLQLDPAITAPANDTCAGATNVGVGTFTFNPCGAYTDEGSASCVAVPSRGDVWYRFTAPSDGEYRFQTCGGSNDSTITLYDNCNGSELACNDDVGAGVSGCSSTRSRISRYNCTTTTPIYVRVGNINRPTSATGSLQILAAPPRPANDDCSNATIISTNPGNQPRTAAFDVTEATLDWNASCGGGGEGRDVWYRFTAPQNGMFRASTCPGTTWNTVLSFFDGCFGTEQACNDDASITGCTTQSIIQNFPISRNQVVYVRVSQKTLTTTTTGTLTYRFTPACPADYDNNGAVEPSDIALFVNVWLNSLTAPNLDGDYDGNGLVEPADIATYVNAWLAALSTPC